MNKRFVNKYFNLSNNFLFVSFDEMRSFNEDFFWNFSNYLFFLNHRNFLYFFVVFMSNNYLITYFSQFYKSYFRHFNLNRNLLDNINYLVLFDDLGDCLLNFNVFWLVDYKWNLNLHLFYNLSSFVNVVRYFYYLLNLRILYLEHLNYLFDLFEVSHFNDSLN